MAIDVTATDNYTELTTTEKNAVDLCITRIQNSYGAVLDKTKIDNIYAVFKKNIELQPSTAEEVEITSENFTKLDGSQYAAVVSALEGFYAAYAATDKSRYDNIYMILREQNESREER